MFLASNCTCAVYFTYTAHVQLLAKKMVATHVHAICTRILEEDNPLYVFTLWQSRNYKERSVQPKKRKAFVGDSSAFVSDSSWAPCC